jgi:hypothetical protein
VTTSESSLLYVFVLLFSSMSIYPYPDPSEPTRSS